MAVIQFPLTLKRDQFSGEARIRQFAPGNVDRPREQALWGVPGKLALLERLAVIGELAPDAPLSFVVVKVEGGVHPVDDERELPETLLHEVASRIRSLTRATDMMGRLSESSFGLVLQGTGATAAGAVAARLSHHLNQLTAGMPCTEVRVSAATGRGLNAGVLPSAAMESFEECC